MSQALFYALAERADCDSNAGIGRYIGMDTGDVSRWRNGKVKISASTILQIYDLTGWSIEHIRALIADKSPKKVAPAPVKKPKKVALASVKKAKKPPKVNLLAEIAARPKRAQRKAGEDNPRHHRLIVTKTPQWTSTVHRVL